MYAELFYTGVSVSVVGSIVASAYFWHFHREDKFPIYSRSLGLTMLIVVPTDVILINKALNYSESVDFHCAVSGVLSGMSFILLWASCTANTSAAELEMDPCAGIKLDKYSSRVISFGFIFLMMVGIYKARKVNDGFFRRSEFIYLTVWVGVSVFLILVLRVTFWTDFMLTGIWALVTLYPLWKAAKFSRPRSRSDQPVEDMELLASHPAELARFREHIKKEFAVENLTFYETVHEFQEKCKHRKFHDTRTRNIEAIQIYSKFIQPESPIWINLGFQQRRDIEETLSRCIEDASKYCDFYTSDTGKSSKFKEMKMLDRVPDDIFSAAMIECVSLMRGSVVRFSQSGSRSVIET
eukprot:153981_1